MKRLSLPASTPASNTLPASSVRLLQSASRPPPWRRSRCVCGNTSRPGPPTAKSSHRLRQGECTMPIPLTYSFARYLTAKKSVDDRALNGHVWQGLVAALPRATPEQPLRVLEVGAGLGTMVERLFAGDMLTHATYTAIDLLRFVAREQGQRTWDLLMAQALLDLVHVPTTLPALLSLLRPGGLLYCPITFDGGTVFQPEIAPELDVAIEACYHQTMDRRLIAGKP